MSQLPAPVRLDSPEDLRVLMGAKHAASDEQWAAITSPYFTWRSS